MFEVLTAVVIKSSVFWDITSCNPLKFGQRFGGICRLHLQDRRISQVRNQHEACSKQSSRLHSFISQKIELFNQIFYL
jgi:hypothetical protein